MNRVDHDLPVTGEGALPTAGGESPKGWHQCLPCQTPAPPRSFHCKICKVCVLKRDHHCFFTASCIGFRNQRYYLVLVFYTIIGCIYGLIAMFDYLNKYLPLASSQMITYIFQVALYKWVMGNIPFYFVFLILQIYATTVLVGGAIMFFLLVVAAVFNGQTMYEAGKLICCYRLTPAENFRSVFGRYWLLNFIFPTPFAQEGDGMSWAVGKSLKENWVAEFELIPTSLPFYSIAAFHSFSLPSLPLHLYLYYFSFFPHFHSFSPFFLLSYSPTFSHSLSPSPSLTLSHSLRSLLYFLCLFLCLFLFVLPFLIHKRFPTLLYRYIFTSCVLVFWLLISLHFFAGMFCRFLNFYSVLRLFFFGQFWHLCPSRILGRGHVCGCYLYPIRMATSTSPCSAHCVTGDFSYFIPLFQITVLLLLHFSIHFTTLRIQNPLSFLLPHAL